MPQSSVNPIRAAQSKGQLLDMVARWAATLPPDAVVLGHGWDESGWPDPQPPNSAELDRAAGGRRVYLSRVDVHSALASEALLAAAPAIASAVGYAPSGWLRRDAHHAVRDVAMASVSPTQRRAAQRAALRHAASLGIVAVHECGGPHAGEDDLRDLLELSTVEDLPQVFGYWGELSAAAKALDLGATGAAGDLWVDGAIGSHTAFLRSSYVDDADGGVGFGYVTADEVAAHLVDCTRHRTQGGFHAIGDAAIATVLKGFAVAEDVVGLDRLRAGRHRMEHAEVLDNELIAGLVRYGVTASVQPAFDRLWGGETGMYARRLGRQRALAANPLAALAGVGVAMAFGSDSPVTPLDPWGAVRAAANHHNGAQRMSARAAFAAHTRGGWRAAKRDDEGLLTPGAPATFAVWDAVNVHNGLPVLSPAEPEGPMPELPKCRLTVLRGTVLFNG